MQRFAISSTLFLVFQGPVHAAVSCTTTADCAWGETCVAGDSDLSIQACVPATVCGGPSIGNCPSDDESGKLACLWRPSTDCSEGCAMMNGNTGIYKCVSIARCDAYYGGASCSDGCSVDGVRCNGQGSCNMMSTNADGTPSFGCTCENGFSGSKCETAPGSTEAPSNSSATDDDDEDSFWGALDDAYDSASDDTDDSAADTTEDSSMDASEESSADTSDDSSTDASDDDQTDTSEDGSVDTTEDSTADGSEDGNASGSDVDGSDNVDGSDVDGSDNVDGSDDSGSAESSSSSTEPDVVTSDSATTTSRGGIRAGVLILVLVMAAFFLVGTLLLVAYSRKRKQQQQEEEEDYENALASTHGVGVVGQRDLAAGHTGRTPRNDIAAI